MKFKNYVFIVLCTLFVHKAYSEELGLKPNIIFILTDDQPYDLLGCNGNSIIQTPNLDKLAKDGVRFTNAHVSSAICTPSRVSILLGQYERKHGVNFNSGTSIAPEAWEKSYPVIIRENGYYTGYIGKNHSPIGDGGYKSKLIEESFDYWYAGHGHLSFYPKNRHEIFDNAYHDTQVEIIGEGVQDFVSNDFRLKGAVHFLESRPEDQPFCLNICFNLPHGASTSTMKMLKTDSVIYRDLYRDLNVPLPENYIAKKDIKQPKLPKNLLRVEDRQAGYNYVDEPADCKERLIRQMQAMTGIDGLVGELRKSLKEKGLDKNTIIIYTSDHGLFMGQQGLGGKSLCYEVCTRVPMIVYNPMDSKSHRGKVSDALVQTIDIAPTILSYAGVSLPDEFQGEDISQLLSGSRDSVRSVLFTENLWSTQFGNPRCEAVQTKEWKYIRYYKNENLSATKKIAAAKSLGIPQNKMLYSVHDPDIAQYRVFAESPLQGEKPVYEELYHISTDRAELYNLAKEEKYLPILNQLRKEWKTAITYARGDGSPKVLRYTSDSMMEKYGSVKNH